MKRLSGKRVWLAGHNGMVGSALDRRLAGEDCDVLTVDRKDVDLTRQEAVEAWMRDARPELVFVAAAKVGGILANERYPADFIYDNLMIEANIIHAAYKVGVEKLLFLGSSCIYPTLASQPIKEEALLTGALEPTNEWYSVAKIAGIKLCQAYRRQHGCDFISAMPTNLYGPGDNFDPMTSHVVPALFRKMHDAKMRGDATVEVWGTGNQRREFLYVNDCADALVLLMTAYSAEQHVNVGTGADLTIHELAERVRGVVGVRCEPRFTTDMPDGTPRKLLDVSRLSDLGWSARTSLDEGLRRTYAWFLDQKDHVDAIHAHG